LKPWPIRHEPSQLQRGLSAVRIRPCLRGLPTASPHSGHGEIPALRPGTMLVVRPPGVLSPFASTAALPSSREAFKRFLREHYFSFVARTDSCANPSSLFSPSGVPLVREVFAGCTPCCEWDLPDVISANPSLDARPPTPAVPQGAHACFFPCVIGLPRVYTRSASRDFPLKRLRSGWAFRSCRHFVMFRPPGLLAPPVVPTAVQPATEQPGLIRPS